ncbi:unnamed protein product [Ilex paraguariensis]|uniref:Ubiquitin-fold modifier-conjugating enzyme 1 n=1 Tax=Ilex paraguariensis TaxID=185542 RepID=A0ABC8RYN6_9AQUA
MTTSSSVLRCIEEGRFVWQCTSSHYGRRIVLGLQMYRGGKICLTVHFKPLWVKNCPRFGIEHALCLGLELLGYCVFV